MTLAAPAHVDWDRFGEVMSVATEEGRVRLRLPRDAVAEVTVRLLADAPVADLAIEEPPLEGVIDEAASTWTRATWPWRCRRCR